MGFIRLLYAILIAFSVTGAQSFASDNPYPQLPYFGPNCWNFVLMYKKAMPLYRSVNMHEFWYYMKSPYCHELNPDQKPIAGDIGTVLSLEKGIAHSFILIDPKTTLSKGSPYPDNQIEEQPLAEISDNPNFPIIYHRCDFSKVKMMPKDSLYPIEIRIDQYLTSKRPIDHKDLNQIIVDLLIRRETLLGSDFKSTGDSFYKMTTLFKIESLATQAFQLIPEKEQDIVSAETTQKLISLSTELYMEIEKIKSEIKKYFR